MGWHVEWTPYGPPAAAALRDAVAAGKAGDPLAPVTVIVPSNHVGVAARRHLAATTTEPPSGRGVGIAAVTFATTYRVAELLGAAALAGDGRKPVSIPVLAAAMRAELADRSGLFAPVATHPATESALVAAYRELRDLAPAALDAVASAGPRAGEVVRLARAVRARLAPEWYDEQDLLAAASARAGSPGAAALGAVVVHLPQRASEHGARLLAALAEHRPATVVAGLTGVPEADEEVLATVTRLGALGTPPDGTGDPTAGVAAERTTVLTASDADEEVRAAVRAIVAAVRAGTRLDRIAVLHASAEPYARLAHEQLTAAGVPTNGAAVVPLAARVAGRTLLDLLALPSGGFRRQDVFAWLASAPVLHHRRLVPTTAWERLSRDAAVVAGRADWDERLEHHAVQCERRAVEAELDDEAPEWQPARERSDARRARELRDFVIGVVDGLAGAAARPRPWSEHAAWAQRWLEHLLGGAARRDGWDVTERRAAERVEEALRRLGALDAVEPAASLDVFHRTLQLELEGDLGRVGRLGEGVLVGSVEMGIGLDLDLVVVLGLAEGSFPTTVRDDSLLPDAERARAGGALPLRGARVAQQHRQLLASLAGARTHLLCTPRGDLRRSAERVPSRWLLDVCSHLDDGGARWWTADLAAASAPWVRHVASFDAGLRAAESPATEQEHRLRALLAAGGDLAAVDDPTIRLGSDVLTARRSPAFTRFDGNLAGLPVPSPVARTTSPTRLERWADCPHRHLVEDLLRAAPVENPEDSLTITPLDKGSLVHEALERFLREVLARPVAARPAPGGAWTAADADRLVEIGQELCDRYEASGLVGRQIFWRRDRRRLLDDLVATLAVDSEHRAAARTAPAFAELAFGFVEDSIDAVEVELPDGRTLRVRGRIDRVDVADDGTLHVIDYKTGSYHDGYRAILGDDPVGGGTKLQLPLYGLAGRVARRDPAAAVRADYWFVTSRGGFTRCGYDVTDDVLDRTTQVLDVIVRGIDAGVFPPHPPERSTFFRVGCHVCDPDGLGTAELRTQWERKRDDPALHEYAELAEPLDDEVAVG
jgi:hypothetical protein